MGGLGSPPRDPPRPGAVAWGKDAFLGAAVSLGLAAVAAGTEIDQLLYCGTTRVTTAWSTVTPFACSALRGSPAEGLRAHGGWVAACTHDSRLDQPCDGRDHQLRDVGRRAAGG